MTESMAIGFVCQQWYIWSIYWIKQLMYWSVVYM